VDYCNAILAGASRFTTDKLQRVLNAATLRYDRGVADLAISYTTSCTGWTFLSWCSRPTSCVQRSIDVYSTLYKAPQYMTDCCIRTSENY